MDLFLALFIFYIYMNDILYFVEEDNLANYADDNTPNATTGKDFETVIYYLSKKC